MTSIISVRDKIRTQMLAFLTDTCEVCKEVTTSKNIQGTLVSDSFETKYTSNCLVLMNTKYNQNINVADTGKRIDNTVFVLPHDVEISLTDYIKYKDVNYNIVKLNNNTNNFTKIAYTEAVVS